MCSITMLSATNVLDKLIKKVCKMTSAQIQMAPYLMDLTDLADVCFLCYLLYCRTELQVT